MRSFVASVSGSGFASYILGPVVRPAIGWRLWAFVLLLLAGMACVEAGPSVPLTEGDVESIERESAESGVGAIKAELAVRSGSLNRTSKETPERGFFWTSPGVSRCGPSVRRVATPSANGRSSRTTTG
jgi:hypothetical protein